MLLAVHGRAVAVIGVAVLLALRIFFDGDRVVRLFVFAELDVGQAFAMAVARMRGRRAVWHWMLTELPGRQYGRFRLLCRRCQQNAKKSQHAPCHRVGLFIVCARMETGGRAVIRRAYRPPSIAAVTQTLPDVRRARVPSRHFVAAGITLVVANESPR